MLLLSEGLKRELLTGWFLGSVFKLAMEALISWCLIRLEPLCTHNASYIIFENCSNLETAGLNSLDAAPVHKGTVVIGQASSLLFTILGPLN